MVGVRYNVFIGRECNREEVEHIQQEMENLPEGLEPETYWGSDEPTYF